MSDNAIPTITLLLAFAASAWISLNNLKEGSVFISFLALLEAIWLLFAAYNFLRLDLEESLKATT
jgi:hypothetical protein